MSWSRAGAESGVYVGAGARINGSLKARARVVVDGELDGEVACAELIVGARGVVTGSVSAVDAEIRGRVGTKLSVERTLSVRAEGRVEGTSTYEELEVEKGAVIRGAVAPVKDGAPRDRGPRPRSPGPRLIYVNPAVGPSRRGARQAG